MSSVTKRIFVLALLPVLLLSTAAYMRHHVSPPTKEIDNLVLLIPDGIDANSPEVRVWQDAASEEGLHLKLIRDSDFLNPMRDLHSARAMILPDEIHRVCNDALTGALYEYVRDGGKLMIAYDACTWDLNSHFTKAESRLSGLAGVSYAMYDRYRTDAIHWSSVWGTGSTMRDLQIPPGKYVRAERVPKDGSYRAAILTTDEGFEPGPSDSEAPPVTTAVASNSAAPALARANANDLAPKLVPLAAPPAAAPKAAEREYIFVRYQYGDLEYPSFRTAGEFDGTVLLRDTGGIAAGYRHEGKDAVLFVNLPLSYLEARTDGLLLHAFLRYFGVKLMHLPYMAAVPDGVGGLVFNWHLDAYSAVKPIMALEAAGVFNQGPYSIHITAGPDVDTFHDGKGMNVDHNVESQRFIESLIARGHVIGSHGGWIDNYFGEHLNDKNESEFARYLSLNLAALHKVWTKPITEYSAPVGNHPQWVSRWLERNGILAYYFTGDSAMGPTEVYRDNTRDGTNIWGFPILHLGKYASLEEMGFDKLPEPIVRRSWVPAFPIALIRSASVILPPLWAS